MVERARRERRQQNKQRKEAHEKLVRVVHACAFVLLILSLTLLFYSNAQSPSPPVLKAAATPTLAAAAPALGVEADEVRRSGW